LATPHPPKRYTEEADQAGLAEDAVIELEGHKRTGFPKPLLAVWEKPRKAKENQSES
jgi:hypothetical protein